MIKIKPGETIEVIPGYFAHSCYRCFKSWVSQLGEPETCAKCRNKYWRTPVTRKTVSEARKKSK
ncbi:MAG: hypothetical protein IS860_06345 [Nitrosopumilus sp.]|nr:hypothetical protein [Nitrosopumilus sp.]